jgi:hypothetical protein
MSVLDFCANSYKQFATTFKLLTVFYSHYVSITSIQCELGAALVTES